MARNEQLIRQHKVLQILERSRFGRTLKEIRDEIVEELGLTSLHERSVRRDLEALRAVGFDIRTDEVERGRVWKVGPLHRSSHKVTTSATELMALSLGRDLLLPMMGTPFWNGIESFWHKVRESLPASVWEHYEKYRRVLHVLGTPAKSYEKHRGVLKTINRAILEHRIVEIEYQSIGSPSPSKRFICPYALALYQSSIYVIASKDFESGTQEPSSRQQLTKSEVPEPWAVAGKKHDKQSSKSSAGRPKPDPALDSAMETHRDGTEERADHQRLRHYKLDRFRKATALDKWFKPQKEVDVRRHLQESIGIFAGTRPKNFRIKISELAARWVLEDPWHADQRVKHHADGSITLSVKAAHELEIIPRVLALGAEAEVLSPVACRRAIADTIRQLHERYTGS